MLQPAAAVELGREVRDRVQVASRRSPTVVWVGVDRERVPSTAPVGASVTLTQSSPLARSNGRPALASSSSSSCRPVLVLTSAFSAASDLEGPAGGDAGAVHAVDLEDQLVRERVERRSPGAARSRCSTLHQPADAAAGHAERLALLDAQDRGGGQRVALELELGARRGADQHDAGDQHAHARRCAPRSPARRRARRARSSGSRAGRAGRWRRRRSRTRRCRSAG